MIINLTFWTDLPRPANCDSYPPCANSLRPALVNMNATGNDADTVAYLPNGHIVRPYIANIQHPDAKPVDRLIGLGRGMLTFGIDQGAGEEIIVAKLTKAQVNSRNIELMIREILKLRPHPDGGALYNPDFGLIHIGKKTDAPGGSLIGLSPFLNEVHLDFDRAGAMALIDGLKFGGLLALALLLLRKKKGSNQDKTGEIKL